MKRFLLLAAFSLLILSTCFAKNYNDQVWPLYAGHGDIMRPRLGAATIVGICAVSVGPPVALIGLISGPGRGRGSFLFDTPSESQMRTSQAIMITGIVLTIAGGATAICGRIHDRRHSNRRTWGLVAPKRNEIGLAYNF